MNSENIKTVTQPDRILSYFAQEKTVLAIVTVTGLLYNIGMAAGPYFEGQLAQCLYDIIEGIKTAPAMVRLAAVYVGVIAFVQVMRAFKRYYVRIFANDISRMMRHILYHSLVNTEDTELTGGKTGSLMTKAISDVNACSEGMRKFTTEVFDTGVVMVVYLVMLLALDWRLTMIALIFTPIAYVIAAKLEKTVAGANSSYKKSAAVLNQMTMDRIGNAITWRMFGRETNRNEAYEVQLTDYEQKSARANIFEGSMTPVYDAIAMIGTVMILYFGSRNVTGAGFVAWDIASFTTYLACFTKLAVKASHAAKLFNAVQKAQVSWGRIKPLMASAAEHDAVNEKSAAGDSASQNTAAGKLTMKFDNVSCGYADTRKLTGISFTADRGELIGITGIVASGKSMLGKVLIGETPFEGKILFTEETDERKSPADFQTMPPAARRRLVSYMGHEPELLSTSIRENVALGDHVDVEKWLKAVCLDEDIAGMKDGADTLVGSAGMSLSGGQQARLALARTLAHARPVLVLDDPFSAVDKTTESRILENIREMLPGHIVLLISHRLTHFPETDQVLFLHDGTADCASHEELLNRYPEYRKLYEQQAEGGDLDEQ